MFTKIFAALTLVLFCLGCNRNQWGEKPAAPTPSNKIGSEIRCLKDALPVMQGFLQGEAQPAQVSLAWRCFSGALELFKNRVRGEHPKGYTATELKDFFQRYFLKEGLEISPTLLGEIMRFKQVFVGGENQIVTRAEIQDLIQFAGEMESLSLELLPSMKILAHRWAVDPANLGAGEADFELAKMRAEKALLQLATRIESKGQSYKIANFVTLMEELQSLYGTKWDFVDTMKRGFPLFQKLKKTLMGTDEALVLATEWRQFGMLGVRSYLLYLRYQYFVKNLPEGVSSGPDFRLAFKAVDDLVITIGSFISEKPTGRLETQEIDEVLAEVRKIFPDFQISPDLVPETMKLKVLLVGGSSEEFSSQDFANARRKLTVLRAASDIYHRWNHIYSGSWNSLAVPREQARASFTQAQDDLVRIAGEVSSIFETDYELRDLQKLLKAFGVSFPPKPGVPSVNQKLDKYFGLAISLKNLVLNDWMTGPDQQGLGNSMVVKKSWKPLLQTGARIYTKYLHYQYFVKSENWARRAGLEDAIVLAKDLREILTQSLKQRKDQPIRSWEISQVFEQARVANILTLDWKPEFVRSLVDKLVQKVLTAPEKRLSGATETQISQSVLNTLFFEVDYFLEAQTTLDHLLSQKPLWDVKELRDALSDQKESSRELVRILETSMAMSVDDKGRVDLSTKSNRPYDEASMLRLNIVRAGTRLFLRSYSGTIENVRGLTFLTAAEVDVAFADWRPVAIEFGILDPANERFAKNRFLEANLFTPFSDGNDQLSYQEGAWLFAYVISGVKINAALTPGFEKACGKNDLVDVTCALQSVDEQASVHFGSMPELQTYLAGLEVGKRRTMIKHLFTAIGWNDSEKTIKKKDLSLFPHTLQYIESTMKRTDLNGDGVINSEEAWILEPTFRPLLAKVSGFGDEHWLKALFAYILVYGDAPNGSFDELFFAADWVNRSSWPIEADRSKLAQILGVLTARARALQ